MVPRRFATREELLGLLQELGRRLGRVPTAKDVDANRGWMPSKSLYWHTFGSLTNALKEAGFDVPVGEERLERAIAQGAAMARRLGHLPKFTDWAEAREDDASLLTEWQVYRMFDARRGAWSTFQYLVRERLKEEGVEVERDGCRYAAASAASRARQNSPSSGARTVGRVSGWYVGSGVKRSTCTARAPLTAASVPSATCRLRRRMPTYCSAISSARSVEAKKSSRRVVPIQSGRPTPRAR